MEKIFLRKNDIVTLAVTDMAEGGEGIGRVSGYPLFIKDAVVGDSVEAVVTKAGKSYGFARVLKVTEPSPDRVAAPCPVAAPCGGCQLQALSYPAQLAFKERKVREDLIRLGGFDAALVDGKLRPILGMESPLRYRNKVQLPVGEDPDGKLTAGYYAQRSHRIVSCEHCLLDNHEDFAKIRDIVLAFCEENGVRAYDEASGKGLLRHILIRRALNTGEWMVSLVVNGRSIPKRAELVRRLLEFPGMTDISLCVNTERTNVILGTEIIPLYGPGHIRERIGDLSFRLSPLSFFQVNTRQTERLYAEALRAADLSGSETVWDLYCGTGTISLFLARKAAKVCGVEIVAPAVENARRNAEDNKIANAEFFVGKSEEVFPGAVLSGRAPAPDAVVLDPPRKGCEKVLLDAILSVAPARIVYVSCDPATLARDLKILCAGGAYALESVQPVDMFPMTMHVETVCLLSKLYEAKHHISVQVDMDDLDLTAAESKATYEEIQDWVQEKYGFHVTHLNIAQVKRKHGIIERENYNKPKSPDSRQPGCPAEKSNAIEEALKHFQMI